MALPFCFWGNKSPTSVPAIIATIMLPVPSKKKKTCIHSKSGAKKFPIADTITRNTPDKYRALCLKRTTKKPIAIAAAASPILFTVLSWLAIPIEEGEALPKKVIAISTRNSVKTVFDMVAAKLGTVVEAINDLKGFFVCRPSLHQLLVFNYLLK